jgi:hypothetical protein
MKNKGGPRKHQSEVTKERRQTQHGVCMKSWTRKRILVEKLEKSMKGLEFDDTLYLR